MTVKLLIEHHFEFLSLKGGCLGSSESTLVKMPHCRKSHVAAIISDYELNYSLLCGLELCEAQWLCWYSVRLRINSLLVRASSLAESLCCVLEQSTLSAACTEDTSSTPDMA